MAEGITYDRIMQTAMGFFASKTLKSAVELGVFSALAQGPLDAETLRRRVGIHERAAGDFFEGFLHGMTGITSPVAQALSSAFPWTEARSVVDIGSAQGCVPVQLALAHPHLMVGGFDLPEVEPIFARFVADHGLAGRVQFVPGDFFNDALPRADVLVMGMILHDWDLPTKLMLIKKACAALPTGRSLIVCEMLIDDERRTHVPGLLMSLNMLIETRSGFDFTAADCKRWMTEAGFSCSQTVPLAGPYSAVIGTK